MSIYTCKLCDQQKDCDFDGCYEYEDGLICDDCEEIGIHKIKPIPKIESKCREVNITRPLNQEDEMGTKDLYGRSAKEIAEYFVNTACSGSKHILGKAYLDLLKQIEGKVMVPVEPTEEEIIAGVRALVRNGAKGNEYDLRLDYKVARKIMIQMNK